MGGASLVVWAVLLVSSFIRTEYSYVGQRFEQIAGTFALLSIVCNHPHFMASYRMAYGRGWRFCARHWFTLIAVPAALILLYAVAYFAMENPVINATWIVPFNFVFEHIGIGFRFGNVQNLGSELVGASIWLMYLTVGWHYAKQIFGCMMVYANYDAYPLSGTQRRFIKLAVFSVAFFSFCHLSFHWRNYFPFASSFQLYGLALGELGLPTILESLSFLGLGLGVAGFLYAVVYRNFRAFGKLPTANFLVPFVAFYAWWVPLFYQKEFYFMIVPFFHSLQYLPFAYRMEMKGLENRRNLERKFAFRLVILLIIGFVAFEALPSTLDTGLSYSLGNIPVFFTIAFAVFINIHHFFIDSVLWRFQDEQVRRTLLSPTDPRRIPADTVFSPVSPEA